MPERFGSSAKILDDELQHCLDRRSQMDDRMVGLIGGIAGGVIGVIGGAVGTYFGIRNTNGPKERRFTIRAAVFCWFGVSAFLACLFLLPRRWNLLLWLVYVPSLFWFARWANDRQVRAKVEDALWAERADGQGSDV
jgi:uncharacterized membrane protein YfcA